MERVGSAITRSVIYAVDTGLDQIVLKKYIIIRIYYNSTTELTKKTSFRLDWTAKSHYIFNFKPLYTRNGAY